MKLCIIAGFLGSGKTTLMIKLAQAAIEKGLKSAIIVNEIGQMGVDDQLMKQLDLDVWQLLNGCICCTLTVNLVETLNKLKNEYSPDLVLMEPSGAASMDTIISTLDRYYKDESFQRQIVSIVDPLRIEQLFEVLTPLITSQIGPADKVIINKKDVATPIEMGIANKIILEIDPEASITEISAKNMDYKNVLEVLEI